MTDMKRWLRYFCWAIEIAVILAGVYFEPSFQVRGTLWNEAFYDGKPTSWWRQELARWDVENGGVWYPTPSRHGKGYRLYVYTRESTWFEKQCERWKPATPVTVDSGLWLLGPKLLHGEADAEPVLSALLEDRSPKVRRIARIGLRIPAAEDD